MSEKLILALFITCLLQILANLYSSAISISSIIRKFDTFKAFTEYTNHMAENSKHVISPLAEG